MAKQTALMPGKCSALKEDGKQCMQTVGKDVIYCLWHDPSRANEAREARELGGKLGSPPPKYILGTKVPIEGLQDVLDNIGEIIGNLQALRFTPSVANSMLRALQIASSCYLERQDREELEVKMEELREAMGVLDEK